MLSEKVSKAAQREMVRAAGDSLAGRKSWVLHEQTLAIGQVAKFWDGEVEQYVSAVNGKPVPSPVLELETGHGLVFDPEKFVELDASAVRFFLAFQQGLSGLVVVSATNARASGVAQDVGLALTVAALRAQLAAIEAREAARGPEDEVLG